MLRFPLWICSPKEIFKLLFLWSVISCLLYGVIFTNLFKVTQTHVDLSKNYFQSVEEILTGGFLVHNEKCRIPDLNAWNAEILPFANKVPPFECHDQPYYNLTYVTNNTLIINEDVLEGTGYGIDDIYCCYQTIERVEQSRSKYDAEADNGYKYSESCYQMEKFTKTKTGLVKVICNNKGLLATTRIFYQNYHLIAQLPDETDGGSGSDLRRKISFWRKYLEYLMQGNEKSAIADHRIYQEISRRGKPPNILILGFDSTSRLKFHRFMNRSIKVLRDVIKPVEMLGYTKVGENTFPNMVPLFTSFSEDELKKVCYPSRWTPQDGCPYIWKAFAKNHYLTALLEDSPTYATFNYLKTAFIKPPVDMYIRPFMLALYEDARKNPTKPSCMRYQRPEEIVLNYMVELSSLAESRSIPFFIHTWMTDLTHDKMDNLQTVDDLFAERLLQLHERGLLKNTILFVMGDHGYRFLDVRSTSSGWFEDKLPAMWIKLPETIISTNPDWLEALQYNSKQLVTPFDIHEMLREIFNKYAAPRTPLLRSQNGSSLRGMNPFRRVPSRTCQEAGIPEDFCPCLLPVEYNVNKTLIKQAGEFLIQSINSNLPSVCAPFSSAVITASGTFNHYRKSMLNESLVIGNMDDYFPELLIVAVKTTPGDFILEARVGFNKTTGEFDKVSHILRMNQIIRSTKCLNKNELAYEYLCYCPWYY